MEIYEDVYNMQIWACETAYMALKGKPSYIAFE